MAASYLSRALKLAPTVPRLTPQPGMVRPATTPMLPPALWQAANDPAASPASPAEVAPPRPAAPHDKLVASQQFGPDRPAAGTVPAIPEETAATPAAAARRPSLPPDQLAPLADPSMPPAQAARIPPSAVHAAVAAPGAAAPYQPVLGQPPASAPTPRRVTRAARVFAPVPEEADPPPLSRAPPAIGVPPQPARATPEAADVQAAPGVRIGTVEVIIEAPAPAPPRPPSPSRPMPLARGFSSYGWPQS